MDTTMETVQQCPGCGAEVRTDRRFTAWCAACDWNVDPRGSDERHGALERLRRGLALRNGERLLAEVMSGATLKPQGDAATVLAYTLSLAVHGTTVALLVTGVLLAVLGWGTAAPLLGGVLLLLAWLLRPRFGELPDDLPVLHRADAPQLFAMIDEVADVAGTAGVHAVVVSDEVNASVTTYGIRQRRLLDIGLGLWEILTPQQRIALIGHELGHYAGGDTRRGLITGNALRSLGIWHFMLQRVPSPTIGEMFLNAVYFLPRCAVLGLLMLLDRLTLRAAQRGEYLADAAAARAGSTEAAVGLMDRLLVADSAEAALLRESNAGQMRRAGDKSYLEKWRGLWERLAAQIESIPESEIERQRRASELRGHTVDATHPPTHLRRACLLTGEPLTALVVPDEARLAAVADELAAPRERLARRIVKDGRREGR
ncbi:M48 family metallopeptidase [Streptomyces pristinaespiralis]|uniref:M48 family metallopeptidase n=1 Tax=Streptomyces pristinaespiralis TaxID=38300 RepID=UPI0033E63F3D